MGFNDIRTLSERGGGGGWNLLASPLSRLEASWIHLQWYRVVLLPLPHPFKNIGGHLKDGSDLPGWPTCTSRYLRVRYPGSGIPEGMPGDGEAYRRSSQISCVPGTAICSGFVSINNTENFHTKNKKSLERLPSTVAHERGYYRDEPNPLRSLTQAPISILLLPLPSIRYKFTMVFLNLGASWFANASI